MELDLARVPLGSHVADKEGESEEKEGVWDGAGYMRAKKRKLREQFAGFDQERTSDIFKGVTIYVNGWTQPNADELKRLVHTHGGRYEYNLYGDSGVTHTIATNLPNAKIRNLKDTCVCTPDWIVDSIESGKRLPVDKYLLYARQPTDQKTLEFKATGKKMEDATYISSSGTDHGDNIMPSGTIQPTTEQVIPTKQSVNNSLEKLIPKAKPTSNRPYDATSGAAFVSDYYTYSRLHYLSAWSTELKHFTSNTLPQVTQKHPKLPTESCLRGSQKRLIVHIDLDCFFVSVSLRDRPHLKGRPVAVCHAKLPKGKSQGHLQPHQQEDPSSLRQHNQPKSHNDSDSDVSSIPDYLLKSMSDIASCSYEARTAGLHNGMFVGEALKLCPTLQLLPYEFDKYHNVSKQFYTILMVYSATIEPVSCDEAYVELTDYVRSVEEAESIVQEMRGEIESATGCTVSAGMAHNMLLARMATRVAKPNGQHFLSMDDVHEFMSDQKVQDLPGVGYATALKLREAGVGTCGQLQKLPSAQLKSDFGSKTGQMLYNYCRGVDERHLKLVSERKSVSVDLNFGIRFQSLSDAENLLKNLSEELEKRAAEAKVVGGTLTLKLMIKKPDAPTETRKYLGHGRCNNVSRSCSLLQPTSDAAEMCRLAVRLLNQIRPRPEDIRGVGLQLTRLVSSSQQSSHGDLRNMLAAKLPSKPQLLAPANDFPALPMLPPATNSEPQPPQTESAFDANLDETFTIDLPPASQLDSSVLNALPSEMREKIMCSYAKLEQTSTHAMPSVVSTNTGSQQKPPSRPTSVVPGGGGNGCVVRRGRGRGKGRGRGRGTGSLKRSPQKQSAISVSPRKQKRLFELLPDTTDATDTHIEKCSAVDPVQLSHDNHLTTTVDQAEERLDQNQYTPDTSNQDKFLTELRAYLKKWVNDSPEGPLDSDLRKVDAYIINLCHTELDVVFIVFQGFRRFIVELGNTAADWSTAFNTLLDSVQNYVVLNYKATLPIRRIPIAS